MGQNKTSFTSETAKEAGRIGGKKGAETRARRAEIKADVRAREKFEQASDQLAQVLIDAALGHKGYERLDPKERAALAIKCLEYGIGRPRPMTDQPTIAAPQEGLHFDVGPPPEAPKTGKGQEDLDAEKAAAALAYQQMQVEGREV